MSSSFSFNELQKQIAQKLGDKLDQDITNILGYKAEVIIIDDCIEGEVISIDGVPVDKLKLNPGDNNVR